MIISYQEPVWLKQNDHTFLKIYSQNKKLLA